MSGRATAVPGAVVVDRVDRMPDGVEVLVVALVSDDPWREFAALPAAVEYEGKIFGRSSLDSDRDRAYFRTDRKVARKAGA